MLISLIGKFEYFRSIFFPLTVIFLAAGCGLPVSVFVPEPVVLDLGNPQFTVVGFRTPAQADSISILGYALFYKVYQNIDEYRNDNDEQYFDESLLSANNEIQPGKGLLKRRGFFIASRSEIPGGNLSISSNDVVILHTGLNQEVRINFEKIDNSENPVINIRAKNQYNLGRTKKRDISGNNTDDVTLKFFGVWTLGTDKKNTKLFDPDLVRPVSATAKKTKFGIIPGDEFPISFGAYTVAISTEGPPVLVYSKPVYLGYVLIRSTDITIDIKNR